MWGQVGLADLIAWTIGSALVASACRRVRPADWFAPPIDVDRLLGITAAALAVFLGIGILRQVVAMARRRREGGVSLFRCAVGWRLAAIALLAFFFREEA